MFGPWTCLNLYHLNGTLLRRFDLRPNIREGNPVVKRDPTVIYCPSQAILSPARSTKFIPTNQSAAKLDNSINLLKPTGYVMHQRFNIQQLYALPTLYLYVLYLSQNKQRLVPLTA